ncbi:MAG: hypothetical protein JW715_04265 [Sedimentisphaerales bacterium]|nr:hypothetical protein [Sedimentisphaerales bacterium]
MTMRSKEAHALFLVVVGLLAWLVPGGGHLAINKKKHAVIIFVTIALTFCTGLYIGSIGVINPVGAKPWFLAQLMNTPAVMALAKISRAGGYAVYARPSEIGQIYTSIAGLLNLLCIVNAVYWAHLRRTETTGD